MTNSFRRHLLKIARNVSARNERHQQLGIALIADVLAELAYDAEDVEKLRGLLVDAYREDEIVLSKIDMPQCENPATVAASQIRIGNRVVGAINWRDS